VKKVIINRAGNNRGGISIEIIDVINGVAKTSGGGMAYASASLLA